MQLNIPVEFVTTQLGPLSNHIKSLLNKDWQIKKTYVRDHHLSIPYVDAGVVISAKIMICRLIIKTQ